MKLTTMGWALLVMVGSIGCDDLEDLIKTKVAPQLAELDPTTGELTYLPPAPTLRSSASAVVAAAGKLYVIGGINDGFSLIGDVDIYDPASSSWSKGEPWPNPRTSVIPVLVGERICIGGGATELIAPVNAFDCFNTTTDTWDVNEPLPDGRQTIAMGVHEGKVYAFGGEIDFGDYLTAAHVFDFTAGSWTAIASLPAGCHPHNGVVTHGGKLYVYACHEDIYAYDPATDTWDAPIEYPTSFDLYQRVELIGDRMHVYFSGNLDSFNATFILDPSNTAEPWSYGAVAEEGSDASDYVGTQHDGQIYTAVGSDKYDTMADGLYRYDPGADEWSRLTTLAPRELSTLHYDGLASTGDSLYLVMSESDGTVTIGQ